VIGASPLRIKEWDYYCILTDELGAAFAIADNSYMGLVSASILDLTQPWEITTSVMTPFPMGKLNMPSSSAEGDVRFRNNRVKMAFTLNNRQRRISVDFCLAGSPVVSYWMTEGYWKYAISWGLPRR
jgi:hypothetical protein